MTRRRRRGRERWAERLPAQFLPPPRESAELLHLLLLLLLLLLLPPKSRFRSRSKSRGPAPSSRLAPREYFIEKKKRNENERELVKTELQNLKKKLDQYLNFFNFVFFSYSCFSPQSLSPSFSLSLPPSPSISTIKTRGETAPPPPGPETGERPPRSAGPPRQRPLLRSLPLHSPPPP